MTFSNPEPEQIRKLLLSVHSIAVVGLSSNEARPSFRVARNLQSHGYRIIPVRPRHGGAEPALTANTPEVRPMIEDILGEKIYPDLESLPELPDIVDVFRAPEHVPAIVESCIKLGVKRLWLQEGVVHEAAAQRAARAGIMVVMNRCMWRDYMQLIEHGHE